MNFQNFAQWYDNHKYECDGRLHIDKDIKYPGNKLYSPYHCILVPQRINMLFSNKLNKRGLPNGIDKNKKGYLLLETVISSFIVITISISLYTLLLHSSKYKTSVEDRVELYEQGEEMCFQINKTIENSDGIISIRDLNGNTISGDTPSYVNVNSIKCKYKNSYRNVKDKEISYKRNHKLFINTLNSRGNSESGGYEIGDYVDFISVMIQGNKVAVKLSLSKNNEKYETYFKSYIKEF